MLKRRKDNLIDQILAYDNMLLAWQKAKKAFSVGDIWYCDYQLCQFEANLDNELKAIINDAKEMKYKTKEVLIAPFPKAFDCEHQLPKTRQAFYISVRDQVTWLAICNVIGPLLDQKMPSWSYGNRIYRPAWYEIKEGKRDIIIGNYRNSSGHIYQKWKQSWPLFRKHISGTLKIMADPIKFSKRQGNNIEDIDEDIDTMINENDKLNFSERVPYLVRDYFSHDKIERIYWAGLDFEKFYPRINSSIINTIIQNEIKYIGGDSLELTCLLNSIFDFRIQYNGWCVEELRDLGLDKDAEYKGLPTGLLVAGFLANIALLDIDKKLSLELEKNRKIAHFRFVDDHVILSTNFEDLINWIETYEKLLNSSSIGATIGHDKTEPKVLASYLGREEDIDIEKVKKSCELDPEYPSPLMTQTLAKVSAISKTELDILSNDELDQLIGDLKHLLITDFPDQEVKKETRISFAATMLSKAVSRKDFQHERIYTEKKVLNKILIDLEKDKYPLKENSDIFKNIIHGILQETLSLNFVTNSIKQLPDETKSNHIIHAKCKDALNSIKNIIESNHRERSSINLQAYKLLKKSVKENHQKVRLWVRLIQFCYNQNMNDKLTDIWSIIETLSKEKKIHNLSATFLYYLYIALIIELSWESTRLLLKQEITDNECERHKSFLNYICQDEFLTMIFSKFDYDKRDYYKSIFVQLKVLVGSIISILKINKTDCLLKFDIIDWSNHPNIWIKRQEFNNMNTWLFWIFKNTHDFEKEECYDFWPTFLAFANIDVIEEISPLIRLFPKSGIIRPLLCNYDIERLFPDIINQEGWLLDYYNTIINTKDQSDFINKMPDNISYKIKKSDTNTLYDWITLINKLKYEKHNSDNKELVSCYDLRLTEWTSLSLMLKVINAIECKKEKLLDFFIPIDKVDNGILIHPANFNISNTLFKNSPKTWDELKQKMALVEIELCDIDKQIEDSRYFISELNMIPNDINQLLYGSAILMIQLLCKKISFPWIWNLNDRNLIWTNAITKQLATNEISSISQLIIRACLSTRNRETILLQKLSRLKTDDTKYDPPIIKNLEDFRDSISKAIQELEKNQISVEGNSPRQLIPISIISLSNKNNPFQEK
ncbi:RNA-directed DNA polymerase [Bacteroides cellulosilyticus]|jgi:hypothetical protein|uniref:RNA-directed DNA polymerase n=1 Tax=Bacteroides cellulosilyticus TaxID=246787 RepID=UPI0018990F7E|nr:RNA-directed DNA polymerase [Bacteroides cellulosilyticus]